MSPLTERKFDGDGRTVFFDEQVQPQFFDLINDAKEFVTFVTPYIDLWENLKRKIRVAIDRSIAITFLIREDQNLRKPEDLQWLRDNGVRVNLVPNLHAKIYLNEGTVLVSSMNILRSSVNDSKEFAMIVKSEDDKKMFRHYVAGLVTEAPVTRSPQKERQTSHGGTCIRCHDKIRYNVDRPLCINCYHEWAEYENEDYPEKLCHSCGKSAKTTFGKPLCLACWKKSMGT